MNKIWENFVGISIGIICIFVFIGIIIFLGIKPPEKPDNQTLICNNLSDWIGTRVIGYKNITCNWTLQYYGNPPSAEICIDETNINVQLCGNNSLFCNFEDRIVRHKSFTEEIPIYEEIIKTWEQCELYDEKSMP